MKIIHTGDIHLDSPLIGVKDPEMRRHELLMALSNLADYATHNGVAAIVVAGDLFDDKFATPQTVQSVADIVKTSRIDWFVLKGNHGGSAPYERLHQLCPEIHFFGDNWTYYSVNNITICGRELGHDDARRWKELKLDPSRCNIVVLHGDVDDNSYGFIDKNKLSICGAKYVALGHRHAFAELKFGTVTGGYCGALEARGFDEAADTGFVEIDTEQDTLRFVKQAIRSVVTKRINVTNINNDVALQRLITQAVADTPTSNYLNVIFDGARSDGIRLGVVAKQVLEGRYFALRIKDETTAPVDTHSLSQEMSLRGEFVKLAMQVPDPQLRDEILRMGLAAINGETLQ